MCLVLNEVCEHIQGPSSFRSLCTATFSKRAGKIFVAIARSNCFAKHALSPPCPPIPLPPAPPPAPPGPPRPPRSWRTCGYLDGNLMYTSDLFIHYSLNYCLVLAIWAFSKAPLNQSESWPPSVRSIWVASKVNRSWGLRVLQVRLSNLRHTDRVGTSTCSPAFWDLTPSVFQRIEIWNFWRRSQTSCVMRNVFSFCSKRYLCHLWRWPRVDHAY